MVTVKHLYSLLFGIFGEVLRKTIYWLDIICRLDIIWPCIYCTLNTFYLVGRHIVVSTITRDLLCCNLCLQSLMDYHLLSWSRTVIIGLSKTLCLECRRHKAYDLISMDMILVDKQVMIYICIDNNMHMHMRISLFFHCIYVGCSTGNHICIAKEVVMHVTLLFLFHIVFMLHDLSNVM